MVFQLVYVSRLAVNGPEQISDILSTSRRNNPKVSVTGLLLHNAGICLQLLEGGEFHVRDLYAKIARDPRHHMVTTVFEQFNEDRLFREWDMDFHEVGPFDPRILKRMEKMDSFMPEDGPVSNEALMKLLQNFIRPIG